MAAATQWLYFFFVAFFFRTVCGPGPSSKMRGDALLPFFLRVAIVTFPPVDNASFRLSVMREGDAGVTDRLRI
jgi:hypothetical protein